MNMKKSLPLIIAALIIAGGSFFAGMQYQKNAIASNAGQRGNFANLTPEQRQTRFQQNGGAGGGRGAALANGGFATGAILSKDVQSITVKLQDGGSKIIYLSDKTQVMKTASGSQDDLTIGEQISAQGSPNDDGSISAQTIQIRPPLPTNPTTNTTTNQ